MPSYVIWCPIYPTLKPDTFVVLLPTTNVSHSSLIWNTHPPSYDIRILLKSMEVMNDSKNVICAYTCGKTQSYFCAGAFEFLEGEKLWVFDKVAIIIQCHFFQNGAWVINWLPMCKNDAWKMCIERVYPKRKWDDTTLLEKINKPTNDCQLP